ncbi:hypothetical protein C2S52_007371 [Perilla frutescens var. hirtella]|uniref:Pectinesterase inhibitor domain-containing protein n=1 Tax=Perilla frutescens var. hirtella TaxID=608512 RepID=A0AAD4JGY3_PERFH|nr:hypothetical protein C2S51_008507 [Perilla frutescens var. frutescens]KAH6787819.1 hypothetical protein C2S52_007371 [Perilla frutescens var. hirtella]KAH6833572.1 hypothetical protein C2S53_005376 [Perilla frutescens var. hirtella]
MGAFPAISSALLIVTALSCLVPSAAAQKEDLAIQVCKKTRDFAFCRAAIYSDPHAPGADRYMLIDIVLRQAYRNATDTRDYIAAAIKSGGGLKTCLTNYDKSVETLEGMLNDLNSESYYDLDTRSLEVERSASNCGKALRGRSPLPLAKRNQNMLKLAHICYLVSKLF